MSILGYFSHVFCDHGDLKPRVFLMSGYHVSPCLVDILWSSSSFSIMTPKAPTPNFSQEILFKHMGSNILSPFGWWLSSSRVVLWCVFFGGVPQNALDHWSFAFCFFNGSESYFRKEIFELGHMPYRLSWHDNMWAMPGHCVHWFLAVLCVLVKKWWSLRKFAILLR